MSEKLISVILPAHNEQGNISVIYSAIQEYFNKLTEKNEVIFVDDGSKDATAEVVRDLQHKYTNVRLIQLTRNFGHQAALMAGLTAARGDAVIVMDCDMQHPPEYLPKMIHAWKTGNYIVQMMREKAVDVVWHKKFFSWAFYKLINLISPSLIQPNVADFYLLDKIVVQQILRLKDYKPFLRGMINWFGFKSTTLIYVPHKRHFGQPSYTFKRSLKLGGHALILISRHPLRLGLYAGLFSAALCTIYIIISLVSFLMGITVSGWTSLIISSLFPGTIQLIVLGILGEYIGYIFDHTRNLPTFVAYPEISASQEIDRKFEDVVIVRPQDDSKASSFN